MPRCQSNTRLVVRPGGFLQQQSPIISTKNIQQEESLLYFDSLIISLI